jgi:heme a synthase
MESQIVPLSLRPRLVANWLILTAALILMMAAIGAITRLTESGLSMTEWRPITGMVPPYTDAAWQGEFDLYRATPEYIHKNADMDLAEFKNIYFWEWIHRQWGRLIGLFFILPLVGFWAMGWMSARATWALLLLLGLGCTQAFVGWFMVQSGLIDRPSVSHYRLALHLFVALMLYALLLWLALTIRPPGRLSMTFGARPASGWLKGHAIFALMMVVTTIIWGAFVAGLDAGLIYNEFPTMGDGRLVPIEMWHMKPNWLNIFENHAAVQFTHRWLAITTVLIVLSLTAHALLADIQGRAFPALAIVVLCQAGLGITTLLSGININLAVMHQIGAVILLGLMIVALHGVFRPVKLPA